MLQLLSDRFAMCASPTSVWQSIAWCANSIKVCARPTPIQQTRLAHCVQTRARAASNSVQALSTARVARKTTHDCTHSTRCCATHRLAANKATTTATDKFNSRQTPPLLTAMRATLTAVPTATTTLWRWEMCAFLVGQGTLTTNRLRHATSCVLRTRLKCTTNKTCSTVSTVVWDAPDARGNRFTSELGAETVWALCTPTIKQKEFVCRTWTHCRPAQAVTTTT